MDAYSNRFVEELEDYAWSYWTPKELVRIRKRTTKVTPDMLGYQIPLLAGAGIITPEEAFWLRCVNVRVRSTIRFIVLGMLECLEGRLVSMTPPHMIPLQLFYVVGQQRKEESKDEED